MRLRLAMLATWQVAVCFAGAAVACMYPAYEKADESPYGSDAGAAGAAGAQATAGAPGGVAGGDCAGASGTAGGNLAGAAGTAGHAGGNDGSGVAGSAGASGASATCSDGELSPGETDVDCGGSCPTPCEEGQSCQDGGDCGSGLCVGDRCGCTPASRRCGDDAPEVCGNDGSWQAAESCPASAPLCRQGECVGPSCTQDVACEVDGAPTSCCASLPLPAGSFAMGRGDSGSDAFADGDDDEQPEHDATLDAFRLDRFLVTVGRFRAFVEQFDGSPPAEGAGGHGRYPSSGWDSSFEEFFPSSRAELVERLQCTSGFHTFTETPGANETYPVNCVSWHVALAFCAWDHARLPTEAEWEYAAAGGEQDRLYAWGDAAPEATLANFDDGGGSVFTPVGATPAGDGRWGQNDLSGTLFEWTLDHYSPDYYTETEAGCDNCLNLEGNPSRALRGGSWSSAASELRAANRVFGAPEMDDPGVGFRCAREP